MNLETNQLTETPSLPAAGRQLGNFFTPPKPLTSKNEHWQKQLSRVPMFASSELPMLLLGESGTGKEVLAKEIHQHSFRLNGPLICINCSAISESLIESELFGHTKGSFTGALNSRRGAFELARGGTLFLDEIGELPLSLQPKLLRAIENKEIWPVGGERVVKTNVRIVAATNVNLYQKINQGAFRSDLFYRLNTITISIPTLEERQEDLDDLIFTFAKELRIRLSFHAMEAIKAFKWPGNIRQLKNFIARVGVEFPHKLIEAQDIDPLLQQERYIALKTQPLADFTPRQGPSVVREFEREIIVQRLSVNNGNQRRTAFELGMPKSTLHDRIKAYGIDAAQFKKKLY